MYIHIYRLVSSRWYYHESIAIILKHDTWYYHWHHIGIYQIELVLYPQPSDVLVLPKPSKGWKPPGQLATHRPKPTINGNIMRIYDDYIIIYHVSNDIKYTRLPVYIYTIIYIIIYIYMFYYRFERSNWLAFLTFIQTIEGIHCAGPVTSVTGDGTSWSNQSNQRTFDLYPLVI